MKLAIALLFTSSTIASVITRDNTAVKGVMQECGFKMDELSAAVKAFDGDPEILTFVSNQLVTILKYGKTRVEASPGMNLGEAMALQGPVKVLAAKGTNLTDVLTDRRPDVEKACQCKTVQDHIAEIRTSSESLIDTVIGKVPGIGQGIARGLADQITKNIQKAEDNYKNCTNSAVPPLIVDEVQTM